MTAVVVMQCSIPVFRLIGKWEGRKNLGSQLKHLLRLCYRKNIKA